VYKGISGVSRGEVVQPLRKLLNNINIFINKSDKNFQKIIFTPLPPKNSGYAIERDLF